MPELTREMVPALIWKRIATAGRLLDLDALDLCHMAGIKRTHDVDLKAGRYFPSTSRLRSLSEKTGLPVEFFLSDEPPSVAPSRFRAGTLISSEGPGKADEYWQRKEILRLGALGDLLLSAGYGEKHAERALSLRGDAEKNRTNASHVIRAGLGLGAGHPPFGPKLAGAFRALGVMSIHYPFYAGYRGEKFAGLSWWQRGTLPIVAAGAALSPRRTYFTMAHELAHLLLHLDPGEGAGGYRCAAVPTMEQTHEAELEREANRIAADLLMPDDLRDEADRATRSRGVMNGIDDLSVEWDVSRQAVALRLVSWALATPSQVKALFRKTGGFRPNAPRRPHEERFGSPDETRVVLKKLHDAGAGAGYIASLTRIPLEAVLCLLGRARPEEVEE